MSRMRTGIVLSLGLILSACAPPSVDDRKNDPVPDVTSANALDLSGRYRIEALADGIPLANALGVSAGTNSFRWGPACAGQELSYRGEGEGVEFFTPGDPDAVCDIGYPQELPQLWAELKGTKQVEILPDRSLRISDGERQWLFQSTAEIAGE